jgi:SAM-dependent methyltransferase
MAAVARTHGVDVEVSRFEDWDDAGRRFDLIICAQAWHWVDPAVGARKAARLLTDGGTLALFWNFSDLAADDRQVIYSVYRRLAPELIESPGAGDDQTHVRALRDAGVFSTVETVTYPGRRAWPVGDWVGNLGTQSNHLLLGPQRLPELLTELRAALTLNGGQVHTSGGTYLIRARV